MFERRGMGVIAPLLFFFCFAALPGQAPEYQCFPTCSEVDTRMLSLGGTALNTVAGFQIEIRLEVESNASKFEIGIFDGDTSRNVVQDAFCGAAPFNPDPRCGTWDQGPDELTYELIADPNGDGTGTTVIATWFGNSVNTAPSGALWSTTQPEMPDNDWWNVMVNTSSNAQDGPGNPFIYRLVATNPSPTLGVSSSFKVRTTGSLAVRSANGAWGIQSAVRFTLGPTGRILYPLWDGTFAIPADFFLNTPTNYDGAFTFFFEVPPGQTDLTIFDGDFDFGAVHTAAGVFLLGRNSGVPIEECFETDDPNSSDVPAFVPFANPEGAVSIPIPPNFLAGGNPPDDSVFDFFRRTPCVRMEVVDPNGAVYRNDNPSGNLEWEQFVITTQPAGSSIADYSSTFAADGATFVSTGTLPPGTWQLIIRGLDAGNTVFLNGPLISGVPAASIGDRVWLDSDGDTVQDFEEPGINGVVVRLYRDDGDGLFNPNPNPGMAFGFDTLVAEQTTAGDGDYLFNPLGAGNYFVDVVESTLPPGAILTTNNEPYRPFGPYPLQESEDHLFADFGYRLPCTGSGCVESNFNGTPIPAGRTIWFSAVGKFSNVPQSQPVQILVASSITNQTCEGGGGDFACNKPIDVLTMIWDGSPANILVNAWKGSVGSALLANMVPVSSGQALTVSGYAGSPNDVIWEIFDASTGAKIGESTFHLSCSDADMNGPEDCGKREGDGKAQSGFINDWILEGLVDASTTLSCTSPGNPGPEIPTGVFAEVPPNSLIILSPAAAQATTVFNAAENRWETTVPSSLADKNIFIAGHALPVTADLPGGIDPVTWKLVVSSDTPGVELQWKWAAAVYNNFSTDLSALGVKPIDGDKFNPFPNSDKGGTPESFRNFVTGGARGGGGSNYTGSYSGTETYGPCDFTPAFNQCDVCKGGVTTLTFAYRGAAPADIVVYDDRDPKPDRILFQGPLNPGSQFTIVPRPGEDKLNNEVSLFVDGQFHSQVHTSCSQPIGPNQMVGNFEIVDGVSKDNGRMCPLSVCDVLPANLELDGDKLRWSLRNDGDVNIFIERITIQWPSQNGNLVEIKRGKDTIHKGVFAPGSATINSGWESNRDRRRIEPGKQEELTFKFANSATLAGDYSALVDFDQGCSAEASIRAPFSGGNFACSKPIDALTMIWDGAQSSIRVNAWKGQIGSTLLANQVPVSLGGEITVTGFAGSPNDVIWEIFDGVTGQKLGDSTFHLSCSDQDMDGPEDCGKRQGDGKGQSGFINAWLLEGMVDTQTNLNCTAP